MKDKEEGLFSTCGSNDVLSMALGTPEHAGRVRGVGGFVKPNAYFHIPRKTRDCVSKDMLRERENMLEETRKLLADQAKQYEARQALMQEQITRLMAVIEKKDNATQPSPHTVESPIISEKASTNIKRKADDEVGLGYGVHDVLEQSELVYDGKYDFLFSYITICIRF